MEEGQGLPEHYREMESQSYFSGERKKRERRGSESQLWAEGQTVGKASQYSKRKSQNLALIDPLLGCLGAYGQDLAQTPVMSAMLQGGWWGLSCCLLSISDSLSVCWANWEIHRWEGLAKVTSTMD